MVFLTRRLYGRYALTIFFVAFLLHQQNYCVGFITLELHVNFPLKRKLSIFTLAKLIRNE